MYDEKIYFPFCNHFWWFCFGQEVRENNTVQTYSKSSQKADIIKSDTNIYTEVDEKAKFNGGEKAFKKNLLSNLDFSNLKSNNSTRTLIQIRFVIERDGQITDVNILTFDKDLNKEIYQAIRKIKELWIPAKIEGKKVRSYYNLSLKI